MHNFHIAELRQLEMEQPSNLSDADANVMTKAETVIALEEPAISAAQCATLELHFKGYMLHDFLLYARFLLG
jgi:hypothetical protein